MTTITKKTSGLFGTGLFSSMTKEYKAYLSTLSQKKQSALLEYKKLVESSENANKGYVYPFKNDVYKFDTNYLGDLILIQEINLRSLIVKALHKQNFQALNFVDILPLEASKFINSALCIVIRYKRVYDLFFRAATVRQRGTELLSEDRWSFKSITPDIRRKYSLPTIAQLETLVKYSLDIPFCLNIIFGENSLEQFSTEGVELAPQDKNEYRPKGGDYKIILGRSKKNTIYLDKYGKIKDNSGKEYEVIGISVQHFEQNSIETRKDDPNEHIIDIMKPKDTLKSFMDYFVHRALGNEYLPDGDNWDLKWNKEDQLLWQTFRLKFTPKLPEKVKPCPCENNTKARRQVLQYSSNAIKKGGNRTVKKRTW
jgi:hypothetical protein